MISRPDGTLARVLGRLALKGTGQMVRELSVAVNKGELFLMYQPKLDLGTGRVSGVEALMRWQHQLHGVLKPDLFIPLAEKAGIIIQMGAWAINEACRQARAWDECGEFSGSMAVNVSALELSQAHFVDMVRNILARHSVDPGRLILEITESCAMNDLKPILMALRMLVGMGVRVALDDFGVGHSSLARLKCLPISEVKVDMSFIREITHCAEDVAIVRAIITMAKTLGLGVVAEGVETASQLAVLANMGCCTVQGHLMGRPMGPRELVRTVIELETVIEL